MASMCDMPDVAWNIISLCSCHSFLQKRIFALKKRVITQFQRAKLLLFVLMSYIYRGPALMPRAAEWSKKSAIKNQWHICSISKI